jgi:hypothetical protein
LVGDLGTDISFTVMRRVLLVLAFVFPIVCVVAAIALPSIDPCHDQMIMACPFLTDDRIGLRLVIGGAGLLAGIVLVLVRAARSVGRRLVGSVVPVYSLG